MEGGPTPGRLTFKPATLEKVFRGQDTAWSNARNKAKLVSNGAETCDKTATIKRVFRKDGSGTTSTFKRFLCRVFKTEAPPGSPARASERISF